MLDKVKIGGMYYEVIMVDQVMDNNKAKSGLVSFRENRINISKNMNEQRVEETLVHEMVHAILFEAGLKDDDEIFVEQFSRILYQVLKENKFEL